MNNATESTPTLILVRGLPGSGKSHLSAELEKHIGAAQVLILDPDAIDKRSPAYQKMCAELTAQGIDDKFFPYRFLRMQTQAALAAGKTVIWNQGFTLLSGMQRLIEYLTTTLQDQGVTFRTLVVEVNVDVEIAKQRVAERAAAGGHGVTDEAWARFTHDYRSFADEGLGSTVQVFGKDDVTVSAKTVLDALEKL
jgi:predicted ABC-type ATPase